MDITKRHASGPALGPLVVFVILGGAAGCTVEFDDACTHDSDCRNGYFCDSAYGYCAERSQPGADAVDNGRSVEVGAGHDGAADGTVRDGGPDRSRPADAVMDGGPDRSRLSDAADDRRSDTHVQGDRGPDLSDASALDARPDLRPDGAAVDMGASGSPPGSACNEPDDCVSGLCATEAQSNGTVPGGLCIQACGDETPCPSGMTCLGLGAGDLCVPRCAGSADCREDWVCYPHDPVGVCMPRCEFTGCVDRRVCNGRTGICEDPSCPLECERDESCIDNRCLRGDMRCASNYNCKTGSQACFDGYCSPVERTPCEQPDMCGINQSCAQDRRHGERNACFYDCASDADCPLNRRCYVDEQSICDLEPCGTRVPNGERYRDCLFGADHRPGTCMPTAQGGGEGPNPNGWCQEAGNAPVGELCDLQAIGRTPVERALQCAPASMCVGDQDWPIHPDGDLGGRGRCATLCDTREPEAYCRGNQVICFDIASEDNDATPDRDESNYLGVCLRTDCTLFGDICPVRGYCRPHFANNLAGYCTPQGATGRGEPCVTSEACEGPAFCTNQLGDGYRCERVCNEEALWGCPRGFRCEVPDGFAFGLCR